MRLRELSTTSLLIAGILTGAWGKNGFFPEDDFLPGWKGGPIEEYNTSTDLFIYMDGGAELYLEYRFAGLAVCEYSTKEGGNLSIELFSFVTPEDAYGIFSLDTSGTRVEIGQGGRSSAVSTSLWKDRQFVRTFMWETGPEFEGVAEAAARAVAERIEKRGELPQWLERLQQAKLEPAFVRGEIALRQVAGSAMPEDIPFERRTGAAWIAAQNPDKDACLVLVYATEAKAARAFQAIWDQIGSGSGGSALVGDRGFVRKENDGVEGIERLGQIILWVPSARNETSCAETLDLIRSALIGQEE